jgi:hypothetical protein
VIKAIPTKYDGIEYRSRTEARWAVFFNYLKIGFDYEREGYQTSKGWYVPDFWLPEEKCWIEIKGQDYEHEDHVNTLYEVCDFTDSFGFVFVGTPKDMKGSFVGDDSTDSSAGSWSGRFDCGIGTAGKHIGTAFFVNSYGRDRDFYTPGLQEVVDCVQTGDFKRVWRHFDVFSAAEYASKYRFW